MIRSMDSVIWLARDGGAVLHDGRRGHHGEVAGGDGDWVSGANHAIHED